MRHRIRKTLARWLKRLVVTTAVLVLLVDERPELGRLFLVEHEDLLQALEPIGLHVTSQLVSLPGGRTLVITLAVGRSWGFLRQEREDEH